MVVVVVVVMVTAVVAVVSGSNAATVKLARGQRSGARKVGLAVRI